MWGINLNYIRQVFDKKLYGHCLQNTQKYLDNQRLVQNDGVLTIPQKHWLIADSIIVDLIWA
jgi:hypothetical protein